MWEFIALCVYTFQWLGVVLGVGAEAVLLVAHLAARHRNEPAWLANIPAVRTVQRWGLVLIIASGAVAVLYQLVNDPSVLFIPTFGFKWALIALCAGVFWLEHWRASAWFEGLAGATWLALFVVHSVAPIFMWVDLAFFFSLWVLLFLFAWGAAVWVMGRGARRAAFRAFMAKQEGHADAHDASAADAPAAPMPAPVVQAAAPKRRVAPMPPKLSKPAMVPPLRPVQPVVARHEPDTEPHEHRSLWQRLFGRHESAAPEPMSAAPAVPVVPHIPSEPPPAMARASAPVRLEPVALTPAPRYIPSAPRHTPQAPTPVAVSGLPAVEHLELMAPQRPAPAAASKPAPKAYVPDYRNLPGVRVMPHSPEELAHESRAPIVQPA